MSGQRGLDPAARRRALRSVVNRRAREAAGLEFVGPRPSGAEVPLTLEQEWLFTAASAVPDLGRLATAGVMESERRLDGQRLRAAVKAAVRITDALNLVVGERGGSLVLLPRQGPSVDWREAGDGAAADAVTDDAVTDDAVTAALLAEPFDPRGGSPLRAAVVERGTGTALFVAASRQVLDRRSLQPLFARIADLYDNRPTEAGAFGFADFAHWHRRRFSPERLRQAAERAAERFGWPRASRLPYDRPPVAGPPVTESAVRRLALDSPTGHGGSGQGGDPTASLLAAAGTVLRRLGATSPLRVGLRESGRHTEPTRALIGQLSTTAAVAFDIASGTDATALLGRAEKAVAGLADESFPIAGLPELGQRAPGAEPFLPMGLDAVVLEPPGIGGGGSRVRLLQSPVPTFDVELVLVESRTAGGSSRELTAQYRPHLFDDATIDALLTATGRVLTGHGSDPLPTARPASRELPSYGDGMAAWGDRAPRDTVVLGSRAGRSAADTTAHMERVRDALRTAGAGAGTVVVLTADGTADTVGALLAALAAGVDVLVHDPRDPLTWTETVEEGARPHLRLRPNGEVTALAPIAATGEGDDDAGALLVGLRARPRPRLLRLPTAVLRRAADAHRRLLGLTREDVLAPDFTWGSEDAAVAVLAAARSGAALVLPDQDARADDRFDALADAGATVAALPVELAGSVPVHLLGLRAAYRRRTEPLLAGEGGPDGLPVFRRWWAAEAPDAVLAGSDTLEVTDAARLFVLNDDLAPVLAGGTGTVWAAADPGSGYPGDAAATADRLRPNPFGPPGSRMARTGALVRVGPDGGLTLAGLPEDRVSVGGRTVLADDIAAAVTGRTGAPAVAGAHPLEWGRAEHPYAVVRPAPGQQLPAPPSDVGESLAELLPPAAVPERVLAADERHGQDPRGARRLAERAAQADARPYEPPADGIERELADTVLAPLLAVPRVGRDDNFFELGGTSLQLIQALVRVRALHGVDIPLADFFVSPTVRRLAELLDRAGATREQDLDTVGDLLSTLEALPEPTDTDRRPRWQ
ncbi:phosphopantetheine-binding protein [Wenjunlia tyrosinilytica]|uniref:Carrier domain-containing protein n=1 Tax=Wenjunlia tyrosinilytica TaxID=1544741 RepID=A0A917ZVD0_9ACTN|nr:phosphopantetheine-binding protein [Wenjunlia tyrosinilytica]GGO94200.1 hypothetical protein GCM10012280_48490 [Wenjunlia tyrosinilytica]